LAAATAAAAPVAGASAAPVAPVAVETGFQTTPHRKRDAIKRAQQLEKWLGVPKLIAFIELLRQDVSLVDTYNALEEEELRVGWVQDQVDKHTSFDFNAYSFENV
jgi:hypothetical protein